MNIFLNFWRTLFCFGLITAHNSSCGKVMFSQACVKNFVHGGTGCRHPPGQTPLPPGQTPLPPGQTPSPQHPPVPPALRSTSGQYASYCSNAFLLLPARFYRCLSVHRGACMVVGGHAWLQQCVHGWGCAWLWGACMVVGGVHGCGGTCGCGGCTVVGRMHGRRGACVVVGGMHGCRGVCMVVGGMHGCREHAWWWGHTWWWVGGYCTWDTTRYGQ